MKNEDLTVYGDGTQTRSFCYVEDLVEGLILLMESNYRRPVNLGNPDEHSMIDFANMVKKTIASKSAVVFRELPEDDPKKRCPDISLASKVLDWRPSISLDEGLGRTIDWYRRLINEK